MPIFSRITLAAALLTASFSATAAMQHRVEHGALAALDAPTRIGGQIRIERVPLTEGEPATLELERFEVWAPDAQILVFSGDQLVETLEPPATQYFRGTVAGQPDSIVFLAKSGSIVEGLIYADARKFAIGSVRTSRRSAVTELVVQETSVVDDFPVDGGFTCEVEKAPVTTPDRPRAAANAAGEVVSQAAPTGTQRSVINLAVETDYELFVRADNSSANVTTFIGNLIGAASTIYDRDLLTQIRLSSLTIQNSASDPFNIVPGSNGTTFDALLELGARWHTTPPSSNKRSAVTLISGKSQSSGIAWLGTLCEGDFFYGAGFGGHFSYCGGIDPPASLAVPNPDANANYLAPSSNYWPLLQLTHELGHNVGSSHTHCVPMTDAQATSYGKPTSQDFVDTCYSGESGCYSGTNTLPAEKGSIMSYCHLIGGGTSTRFTFGVAADPSNIIRTNMRNYMAAITPPMSAISSPSSLSPGASGTASVTSVAGLTYLWTITNGTINGSATGASVNFTATTNPLTLRVTATNTSGCSVTDSKQITVAGAALSKPTNVVATAQSSTSVAISWSAVVDATGYEVWRSADGSNYTLVGTPASSPFVDTTPAAGTAYKYAVVATSGGTKSEKSAPDLAITIVFTDASLAGVPVKALHLTQLRQAVNALRIMAGQAQSPFTDASLGGVTAKRIHITELRSAAVSARTAEGFATAFATDDPLAAGTPIRAAHILDLRNVLR